jgi:hypothetical protein
MTVARICHTATKLPSGSVLIVGGINDSSAELFDGVGAFAATGSTSTPFACPTATLLPSGKVLLAGGQPPSSNAALFDGTGTFSPVAPMTTPREGHTATPLQSGGVLIAGGSDGTVYLRSAEIFDGTSFSATGSMTAYRHYHSATLLQSGKVLMAGGESQSSAELFDGTSAFVAVGSMSAARTNHTATQLGPTDRVLVVGGFDWSTNAYVSSAEVFDGVGAFAPVSPTAAPLAGHTATLLESGKVLVAGGNDFKGGLTSSAELFDGAGPFAKTGSLATPRFDHTATLLASGKVLVAGGQGLTVVLSSAEIFDVAPTGGGPCVIGDDCVSGYCDDGVCCVGPCGGVCRTCSSGSGACVDVVSADDPDTCTGTSTCDATGACVVNTLCTSDAKCFAGWFCDASGRCQPQRARGASCNFSADCRASPCRECTTGFCASGVCCDGVCDGPCDACTAALKQSGADDGACGLAAAASCHAVATCDGSSLRDPSGTSETPCNPYACRDGACLKSCSSVDDCAPSYVCDPTKQCVAIPTGTTSSGGCSFVRHAPDRSGRAGFGLVAAALVIAARTWSRRRRR